ncbi:Rad33p CYBJADRAFT_122613, partial [Cyberlindnera jadinii NRRL Y-1542]
VPEEYEEEILETYASITEGGTDLCVGDLPKFFHSLRIPREFVIGNARLVPKELAVEGTTHVDFTKLMTVSCQLLSFRDNRRIIEETWNQLANSVGHGHVSTLNLDDLKVLNKDLKTGMSDTLLLDMLVVATEGKGVSVSMVDFAYILGKLGQLTIPK